MSAARVAGGTSQTKIKSHPRPGRRPNLYRSGDRNNILSSQVWRIQ